MCPADVPAAIMVLTNRRGHGGSRQQQVEDLSDGMLVISFAQASKQGSDRLFRTAEKSSTTLIPILNYVLRLHETYVASLKQDKGNH